MLSNYINLTRINRPTGIWLLFLPCLFGIALALKQIPNPEITEITRIIALFFAGSILMRSAGCIINDLFDKSFDKKVARTKNRPLASKAIKQSHALILLCVLLGLSFLILLQLNTQAIIGGFIAIILVIIYPLIKRISHYPQLFLGLTLNIGILIAGLATIETIDFNFTILYFTATIWTIIYDTIYAYQDIEDDIKIGVKSTAIRFGKKPQKTLVTLSIIMLISLLYLGIRNDFYIGYFIFTLLTIAFLIEKIIHLDFKNHEKCLKAFKASFWIGVLILIALMLG